MHNGIKDEMFNDRLSYTKRDIFYNIKNKKLYNIFLNIETRLIVILNLSKKLKEILKCV